jgi:hypothetical protein
MAKKKVLGRIRVRPSVARPIIQSTVERPSRIKVVSGIERKERVCADWCALSAWHNWASIHMRAAWNHGGLVFFVPKGKILVIELVTAEIVVPFGEAARLRMNTTLGEAIEPRPRPHPTGDAQWRRHLGMYALAPRV